MSDFQIGVFATTKDGKPKIVLVKSRTGERWIFPKGQPEKGKPNKVVALEEAWEEAGLKGKLRSESIAFDLTHGASKKLYLYHMIVDKFYDKYPESKERKRIQVSIDEAEKLLGKDLRKALRFMSKRFL